MDEVGTVAAETARNPEPDLDVVEGHSDGDVGHAGTDGYPICVRVEGIVYTQEQGATNPSDGSLTISGTVEQQFAEDKRRKSITLWVETAGIYFSIDSTRARGNQAAHIPVGGSVTLNHGKAIWMRSDATASLVSFVIENYAD